MTHRASAGRLAQGFALTTSLCLAQLIAPTVAAQTSSCLNASCFYDHQVRDFRVLDDTTAIIYIGYDRCPFVVKVRGSYCDLDYIPDIEFYAENRRTVDVNVRQRRNRRQRGFQIGGEDGFTTNDRICPSTAHRFALETFGFGLFDEEDVPLGANACSVTSVEKVTDDDLIEIYTREGITAPPPPIGNGTISRSGEGNSAD